MSQIPFSLLSPELIQNIASFVHPNHVALGYKLSCKEVAEALWEQYHTIKLRGEPRSLEPYSSEDELIVVAVAEQPWPGAVFAAHWRQSEPWRPLSRWQRLRLLCLTASSRHPPSLDAALAHCGVDIKGGALMSAAAAGDLEACRTLYGRDQRCLDKQGAAVAGLTGHLAVYALFGCPLELLQPNRGKWALNLEYTGMQQLLWAAASPTPDWSAKYFLPRLQLLANLGVEPAHLLQAASEAAGAIGSTTAAEFCLDELPALLLQRRAAAAPGREAQRWQEQLPAQGDVMEFMAEAAAENQQVAVLRLLRQRGFDGFGLTHLLAAIQPALPGMGAPVLHFLLLEEPEALVGPGEELPMSSTSVFRAAARLGADPALLRLLHEQHGARIDLVAVAEQGSEEAVAWAVDALVGGGWAGNKAFPCRA
ncbi:hypothetical protein HXX76_001052 [Chlamydomonas incerta]|uniref:Uncharacterized protein n=1 Tax=Chlamydomonas incerta TaxID=51695 RepID=A0A835WBD7_CHLIN|nr:hypothetical protein HXX76_001052 [Chlamydomonas incerta]|eukprot:KAG2444295.1 hypothetical protein HXX76_001052 [Chlamydomonas incerta]